MGRAEGAVSECHAGGGMSTLLYALSLSQQAWVAASEIPLTPPVY